ncbi:alpha/beta fold hydrolase [Nitrospira sp. Kam-Ns4a]
MKAQINGITLAYTDEGQGLPIVLLHAFPLNRRMWEPQIPALRERYRVIAVDLRGHGESDAPLWRYSMDEFADDVKGLLDHLGIERAVLAGLSMGGYILFAFWRRHAGRVKALVLADTRATPDTEEGRAKRIAMAQALYKDGPAAVADLMMPIMLSPHGQTGRPDLVERIRGLIVSTPFSGILGDLLALHDRPDSVPTLKAIACPTLVIVGEEDVGTPPSDARLIAEGIAGARLALIPGAGHLSNLEQPEAFNASLLSFLETVG